MTAPARLSALAAIAVLAAAGCGTDNADGADGSPESPTASAPAEQSTGETSPPPGQGQDTSSSSPSDSTGAPGATPAGTDAQGTGAPGAGTGGAEVDPARFEDGGRHSFQIGEGEVYCSIFGDGNPMAAEWPVGCQGEMPPPPELPDCVGGGNKNVAVVLAAGGPETMCVSQGIFVGTPVSGGTGGTGEGGDGSVRGGGHVLADGERITARGYTCAVDAGEVTCTPEGGGAGFSASAGGVRVG